MERGNVVALKSGGSWMTVEDVEGTQITCVWLDDTGGLWRDTFEEDMLSKDESA